MAPLILAALLAGSFEGGLRTGGWAASLTDEAYRDPAVENDLRRTRLFGAMKLSIASTVTVGVGVWVAFVGNVLLQMDLRQRQAQPQYYRSEWFTGFSVGIIGAGVAAMAIGVALAIAAIRHLIGMQWVPSAEVARLESQQGSPVLVVNRLPGLPPLSGQLTLARF